MSERDCEHPMSSLRSPPEGGYDAPGETTASDVIAGRLVGAGCRFVFGIPGGEILTMMDACRRAGIRYVTARHENAGGFMAVATYHARGAPGVVLATVGPGVANLVNVAAHAEQDRVPLLLLTGCLDPALTPSYSHQVFDQQAILAPVCKASFRLEAGAEATLIDKAVRVATAARPGPVHLDIPMSLAKRSVTTCDGGAKSWWPKTSMPESYGFGGTIARRLGRAKRPLMLIGNDVVHQGSADRIRHLAAKLQIPVITTYKAKGVIDEDEHYALGAAGLSPRADALLLPLVAEADTILLVGYDPVEMRSSWREPFSPEAWVLELSAIDDFQFMQRPSARYCGDIANLLEAAVECFDPSDIWANGRPRQVRDALTEAFAGNDDDWSPLTVVKALQELPARTRFTVDTGAHRILMSQAFRCSWPEQMLQSTGLCTMGCALPMAIGAALAEPERPTVAVVGDGGLEMVVGELATARDLGITLTIVVFDDCSLALIEKKQRAEGLVNVGVDFGSDQEFLGTDYDSVAHGFGARGHTVCSYQELRQALAASTESRGIDVITCRLPRRAYDGLI